MVFLGLFSSWYHAFAFLSGTGTLPIDGAPESFAPTLSFTAIGLVIGVSLGHAFVLSRNLVVRTALSGLAGATSVMLLVEVVGVDAFSIEYRKDPEAILNSAVAWGFALGAPVSASMALSVHLLRRTSGKIRLTLLACLLATLVGVRSEILFWEHWDHRALSGIGACGTAMEAFKTPGWKLGMVGALAVCLGTLALDLGARLRSPGAVRTILRRLRLHLEKGRAP